MRKLLMLVFLQFVLLLGVCAQNHSKIELKTANNKEQSKSIYFYGEILSSRIQTVDLKSDKYVFNLNKLNPSVVVLPIKRGLVKYVFSDVNSTTKLDVNKLDEVSFGGENAEAQYVLNEFMPIVADFYVSSYSKDFYSIDLKSFKKKIKEVTLNSDKLIAKINNQYLKEWMQFYFDYTIISTKANYYNFYQDPATQKNILNLLKGINLVDQTVPKSFVDLSKIDINSPYMFAISDDIEMSLSGYFRNRNIMNNTISAKSIIETYNNILKTITNSDLYDAFAVQTYLKYSEANVDWDKYYKMIILKIKNKNYLKELKKKFAKNVDYKTKLDNVKNLPVCSSPLQDLDGNEAKLSDFKGKYVLLDIWTTWCGPCNMELPHLAKKEEKYKNKNIVFVSLSFDKKFDVWKRFVLKKKLKGVQLFAGKSGKEVMDHFLARGYPTFILLGKDGKIIDKDFVRPSSSEFDIKVDSILK